MSLATTFAQWLKRMNIEDLYINSSFFSPTSSQDRKYFLSIIKVCAKENIRVGLLANREDEKDLEFCRDVLGMDILKDDDLKDYDSQDDDLDDDLEGDKPKVVGLASHLSCFLGVFVCKPSEDVKQKAHFIKSQAFSLRPQQKTLTFVYDKDVGEIADILALDEDSQTLIVANNAQIIQPDGAAASLEMFRSFCERIARQEKSSTRRRFEIVDDGSLPLPAASVAARGATAAVSSNLGVGVGFV